jgi:DNA-binding MarR family transcriptional regulator
MESYKLLSKRILYGAYAPKKVKLMEKYYDVAKNCLFSKTRTVSRYITNLSTALKMDRTTINRNLKPLIREGLVFMNESSDKRERLISITDEGILTVKDKPKYFYRKSYFL